MDFFVRSSSRWGAILNYSLVKFHRMANAKLHSVTRILSCTKLYRKFVHCSNAYFVLFAVFLPWSIIRGDNYSNQYFDISYNQYKMSHSNLC